MSFSYMSSEALLLTLVLGRDVVMVPAPKELVA